MRATRSITANIVEGRGRKGSRQFAHFLDTAASSADEVEQHLMEGRDTRVLRESDSLRLLAQLVEVRRMLYGLLRRLRDDAAREEADAQTRKAALKRQRERARSR